MINLAQVAYEAYGKSTNWRTYNDLPMPLWEDLGEKIQKVWLAAALAVQKATRKD